MNIDELKPQLKRLKLIGLLATLPSRLEQATQGGMNYIELLSLVLQDEIERRDAKIVNKYLQKAKFDGVNTFENLITTHYPSALKQQISELKSLHFIEISKNIIIMGPTGTGKTHMAQALGHQACRMGISVLFCRANAFFNHMKASRADNTYAEVMKDYCKPKLLILDDFGLTSLSTTQAEDIYELIAARVNKGAFIITSNRTVDAWIQLFPDPVMANAALDRVANIAYQIIIEGESYRKQQRIEIKATLEKVG